MSLSCWSCHCHETARPLLKSLHWLPVQSNSASSSAPLSQGSVDCRSAIHRRTPTTPSDDAVSAVQRCFASLSAVDTHWDSLASVLCGSSEHLELTTGWLDDICNASSLSTFCAKLKTHFFTVAYSWWTCPSVQCAATHVLTFQLTLSLYKSFYITLHEAVLRIG